MVDMNWLSMAMPGQNAGIGGGVDPNFLRQLWMQRMGGGFGAGMGTTGPQGLFAGPWTGYRPQSFGGASGVGSAPQSNPAASGGASAGSIPAMPAVNPGVAQPTGQTSQLGIGNGVGFGGASDMGMGRMWRPRMPTGFGWDQAPSN